MRIEKTELFVIVTDWFDNPFDDIVFTSLDQAQIECDKYNEGKSKYQVSAGEVMNLVEFSAHQYDKGSDAACWD